jgi:hypothetical protein
MQTGVRSGNGLVVITPLDPTNTKVRVGTAWVSGTRKTRVGAAWVDDGTTTIY